MNTPMFGGRLLSFGQRLSGILSTRNYTKITVTTAKAKAKKIGKAGVITEKIKMPVEKDTNKLVNYVCGSNIYAEGEDVKLKPESEYPDWLWKLHTGPPKTLDELDPNTKSYWRRIRTMACKRNNKLSKLKRFN